MVFQILKRSIVHMSLLGLDIVLICGLMLYVYLDVVQYHHLKMAAHVPPKHGCKCQTTNLRGVEICMTNI